VNATIVEAIPISTNWPQREQPNPKLNATLSESRQDQIHWQVRHGLRSPQNSLPGRGFVNRDKKGQRVKPPSQIPKMIWRLPANSSTVVAQSPCVRPADEPHAMPNPLADRVTERTDHSASAWRAGGGRSLRDVIYWRITRWPAHQNRQCWQIDCWRQIRGTWDALAAACWQLRRCG
jgi:hypothetical protein